MEPKIEDLIKKSGELSMENIKEGSKILANEEKFLTLNGKLLGLIEKLKDVEGGVEEAKRAGGVDESLMNSARNNYEQQIEGVIGAMVYMIIKALKTPLRKEDIISGEEMVANILMTEEEQKKAGPSDYSGIAIKRDQPEEPKK